MTSAKEPMIYVFTLLPPINTFTFSDLLFWVWVIQTIPPFVKGPGTSTKA